MEEETSSSEKQCDEVAQEENEKEPDAEGPVQEEAYEEEADENEKSEQEEHEEEHEDHPEPSPTPEVERIHTKTLNRVKTVKGTLASSSAWVPPSCVAKRKPGGSQQAELVKMTSVYVPALGRELQRPCAGTAQPLSKPHGQTALMTSGPVNKKSQPQAAARGLLRPKGSLTDRPLTPPRRFGSAIGADIAAARNKTTSLGLPLPPPPPPPKPRAAGRPQGQVVLPPKKAAPPNTPPSAAVIGGHIEQLLLL